MKEKLKKYSNLIKGGLAFLLFFSTTYINSFLALIFNIKKPSIKEAVIVTSTTSLIILILLILLYRKELKKEWKIYKDNLSDNIDIGIKYWLIGLLGMGISNILLMIIFNGGSAENEQIVQKMIDSMPLVLLLTAGFIAPINEELVFRKVFKDNINNKVIFILISGIFFGYMHVASASSLNQLIYIIPYSCLGLGFATMYYKTNSVFTSIFMHMFHNTTLTLLSILF